MPQQKTFRQLKNDRLKKLRAILSAKINPYPSQTERTCLNEEAKKKFRELTEKKIKLAGRITALR